MMNLQIKNFYSSPEEIKENYKRENTNSRYSSFMQTHFTAGDEDQFQKNRNATNGVFRDIDLKSNVFSSLSLPFIWEKYHDINPETITNTFRYIFHKFKKGIFVKIKDGKLNVFLPFSKKNFSNEWSDRIKIDPRTDLISFMRDINEREGRNFFPTSVNKFVDTWYANNFLLRYEFPVHEGDTGHTNICDMLQTLCEKRDMPDMEFFINRRDCPIITRNSTEPYTDIYDGEVKLLSHDYEKYTPIFSMTTTDKYADIPIPTAEDWARVSRDDGKYFRKYERDFDMRSDKEWKDKKPTAVFRGSSTGKGVTKETNMRIKAAYISSISSSENDQPLLDAGITSWNLRPRKIKGERYLKTIEDTSLPLASFLSPKQQAEYKYILHIDGHVAAYRLSSEMFSGSCILKVNSEYNLWFSKYLVPFQHYIPIQADLSNLLDVIKWCRENDQICEQIAKNAREFAEKYLTQNGILDYLQNLFTNVKKVSGNYLYNFIPEKDVLSLCSTPSKHKKVHSFPILKRSFEYLRGKEWVLKHVKLNDFTQREKIFENDLSLIQRCKLGGESFVLKTKKESRINHEYTVSRELNTLNKHVENFAYIYDYRDNTLIMEDIQGITLDKYIRGNAFNFTTFMNILIQISLALQVAQDSCFFVHYDLTPWNIILRKNTKKVFYYFIGNEIYAISSEYTPVIIDFERTHVVHEGIHRGVINPFSFSSVQDVLTLLISSVNSIISQPLEITETNKVIYLMNFIANSGYCNGEFKGTSKDRLGDVRFFIAKHRKYSDMLEHNKGSLEKKTPLDFASYINTLTKSLGKSSFYRREIANSKQVYDYTFIKDEKTREESYLKVFQRILNYIFPEDIDKLHGLYMYCEIMENLESVKDKSEELYKNCCEKLRKFYDILSEKKFVFSAIYEHKKIIYNENILNYPEKVLEILKNNQEQNIVESYRPIVQQILFSFHINDKTKKEIKDVYLSVFTPKEKMSRYYSSRLQTLKKLAFEVYSINFSEISKMNYSEKEKVLEKYSKVLEMFVY